MSLILLKMTKFYSPFWNFVLLSLQIFQFLSATKLVSNERPIIGILAQERTEDELFSFIGAPYITHMAGSGARIVPVFVRRDESYYKKIVSQTNGLLFPGGDRNIMDSDFQKASQILFRLITDANDRGALYPIYGVCQGMEMITVLILQQWLQDPNPFRLTDCSSEDQAINLKFLKNPLESRLFGEATPQVIETLTNGKVVPDYHHFCMTPTNFTISQLDKHLVAITTSNDTRGLEFISTFESTNHSRPIYLLQWHPENTLSEFKIIPHQQESLRHTGAAVAMAQYIGNFIVGEARKNFNQFNNSQEENESLIYNCQLVYTMSQFDSKRFGDDPFTQFYLFPSDGDCVNDQKGWKLLNFYLILILILIIIILTLVRMPVRGKNVRRKGYTKINA